MSAQPPSPSSPPGPGDGPDPHDRPTSADLHSEISADELAAMSAHAARGQPIEQSGARIGPYRLLSVLGEGGFGVVWLAEQSEPVRRRVALKIIKPGMDSKDILARFDQERQALALMDHPAIAKVFDGGQTSPESGSRPFFVMELVHGEPITTFCDRERLDLNRRIDLFIRVCDAVQHAHQKGVIHRDIKPSNILVEFQDGHPAPKIIDFGVAKALHRPLTEKTLFTEHGRLIGTPEYMSPEQAEMTAIDIDTRSDIYSLGVLLYELLTGTLPFDPRTLRAAGLLEIQRIIRDVTPPKPSTRLSTIQDSGESVPALDRPSTPPSLQRSVGTAFSIDAIAKARQTDARTLSRHLKRDLDWVVMKCLEKERNRRYATANALAADLRRYLDDEPVSAGPPSVSYRAMKFVRRHRLPVAAVTLVSISLAAATAASVRWARQAAAARDLAEASEKEADEISKYQGRMIQKIDAGQFGDAIVAAARVDLKEGARARGASDDAAAGAAAAFESAASLLSPADVAKTALDQAFIAKGVTDARERFKDRPRLWARMAQTFATSYAQLGLFDKAMPLQKEALDIRRRELGDSDRATLISIACLADLELAVDDLESAIKHGKEALAGRRALLTDDSPETQYSERRLADMLRAGKKFAEAEAIYTQIVDRANRKGTADSAVAIEALADVGKCRMALDDLPGAEQPISKAAELAAQHLTERDRTRIETLCTKGDWLTRSGRHAQARDVLTDAHRRATAAWGDAHPATRNIKQLLDAATQSARSGE